MNFEGPSLIARASLLVLFAAPLVHCSSTSGSGVAAPPAAEPDSGVEQESGASSEAGGSAESGAAGEAGTGSEGGAASACDAGADAALINMCYPDNDGINGGDYTFDLTVDDTGFSKMILTTQNDAEVMLTLKNMGTKPHGFMVGCTSVLPAYPNLPSGCPMDACFSCSAYIPPLAPGASATITFDTPTPDGIIYPFKSTEPSDSTVTGLNNGQWSLM